MRLINPLVLALSGGAMVAWSWGTWPDVLVDFGRELYVPWQITRGRVLYRDLAYLNGPLSAYFNALLFSLLGVNLRTLVFVNIAIAVAMVAMLYQVLCEVATRFAALVACLVFVAMFGCSQLVAIGNYNFVTPYAHEVTHGCALSVLGLWALRRHHRTGRPIWLGVVGLALGLIFLTKAELFIAAGAALLPACVLTLWSPHDTSDSNPYKRRPLLLLFAAAIAPAAVALVLLATQMPWPQAVTGTLGSWAHVLNQRVRELDFYSRGMGVDKPLEQMGRMLQMIGFYALFLLPAAALCWIVPRRRTATYVGSSLIFVLVAGGLWVARDSSRWFELGRPLPLIMLVSIMVCIAVLYRVRHDPAAWRHHVLRLATMLFALMLLLKMILNVRLYHYGFVLAMPATLVLVVVMLEWVPTAIERWHGNAMCFRAAGLAIILIAATVHLRVIHQRFDAKRTVLGQGPDRFLAGAKKGESVRRAMQTITDRFGAEKTMAVVPEGVMINYLMRRSNPTPHTNFMPPELILFGEHHIVSSFQAHPPDFILVAPKNTAEYGLGQFKDGYAIELWSWLRSRYPNAEQIGHANFPIYLLTSNEDPAPGVH